MVEPHQNREIESVELPTTASKESEIPTHGVNSSIDSITREKRKGVDSITEDLEYLGLRKTIIDSLDGSWSTANFPQRIEEITDVETDRLPLQIREEVTKLLEEAITIRRHTKEYSSAAEFYKALSGGEPPKHPINWEIRPYGICLIGHSVDINRFLPPEKGPASGIGNGFTTSIPEIDPFLCGTYSNRVDSESEAKKITEHELMHQYLHTTDVGKQAVLYAEQADIKKILSRNLDFTKAGEVYEEIVSLYANSTLKAEILCYSAENESLSSDRSLQNKAAGYIFDSLPSYRIANPYVAITAWYPYLEDDELNQLFVEQRKEIGLPECDNDMDKKQETKLAQIRDDLSRAFESAKKPYQQSYEEIITLLSEIDQLNLPSWHVVDIVIDNEFLKIPHVLRRWIGEKKYRRDS